MIRRLVRDAWRWRHTPRWGWQRIKRGYSTRDLWSFDTFIAAVVADACENLRDNGHGYPCEMTVDEWNDVLTRIAEPLKVWADEKFTTLTFDEEMKRYEKAREAMRLFADNLGSMWD